MAFVQLKYPCTMKCTLMYNDNQTDKMKTIFLVHTIPDNEHEIQKYNILHCTRFDFSVICTYYDPKHHTITMMLTNNTVLSTIYFLL